MVEILAITYVKYFLVFRNAVFALLLFFFCCHKKKPPIFFRELNVRFFTFLNQTEWKEFQQKQFEMHDNPFDTNAITNKVNIRNSYRITDLLL